MSSYRDDLVAAHERIAELEAQLAARKGEPTGPADEWLARLEDQRARIATQMRRGLSRTQLVVLWTYAVLFGVALPITLAVLLGWSPFLFGLTAFMAVAVGLTLAAVRSTHRDQLRRRLATVDEKIADVRRMVAIAEGHSSRPRLEEPAAPRVRTEAEGPTLHEDEVGEEEEARRTRRA